MLHGRYSNTDKIATPSKQLIYMHEEKDRSLEVHNSVIVGSEGKTENIRIKVNKEEGTHKKSPELVGSTTSIQNSVIVGSKGQTGNISIQTKTKVIIFFAGFISGVITSLCASAIWAGICTIWEHTIKPLMNR